MQNFIEFLSTPLGILVAICGGITAILGALSAILKVIESLSKSDSPTLLRNKRIAFFSFVGFCFITAGVLIYAYAKQPPVPPVEAGTDTEVGPTETDPEPEARSEYIVYSGDKIGKEFKFGEIEQNGAEASPTPIVWKLAHIYEDEGKALLIAENGLFYSEFDVNGSNDYSSSSVRSELNNVLNTFDSEQKAALFKNEVFLLDESEFNDLPNNLRKCDATDYAKALLKDRFPNDKRNKNQYHYWWLRTSTGNSSVKLINEKGGFYTGGGVEGEIPEKVYLVRPGIYVKYEG